MSAAAEATEPARRCGVGWDEENTTWVDLGLLNNHACHFHYHTAALPHPRPLPLLAPRDRGRGPRGLRRGPALQCVGEGGCLQDLHGPLVLPSPGQHAAGGTRRRGAGIGSLPHSHPIASLGCSLHQGQSEFWYGSNSNMIVFMKTLTNGVPATVENTHCNSESKMARERHSAHTHM